ncbi:MAG: NCS2 family permease, partial [bacterium]
YAVPVVGLAVLAVILLAYFGEVRLPLPGGLLAVLVGVALSAATGRLSVDAQAWRDGAAQVGLHLPGLQIGALWNGREQLLPGLGVTVPMGLFNVLGSLQNLES